jgi:hypothetical protein
MITLGDLASLDVGRPFPGHVRANILGDLLMDPTSEFNADAVGYTAQAGPGSGQGGIGGGGGGGYGGHGADGAGGAAGGLIYDTALNPTVDLGSGGGNGSAGGALGGQGGGLVDIFVVGVANINGTLTANGAPGLAGGGESGGGGSGGGNRLRCNILAGSGTFEARGGDAAAAANQGGGGGGGRVAVFANDFSAFTGMSTTSVAGGLGGIEGEPGTAGFIDTDDLDIMTVSSWRFEPVDAGNYSLFNDFSAASTVDGRGIICRRAKTSPSDHGDFSLGDDVTLYTADDQLVLRTSSVSMDSASGVRPAMDTDGGNVIIATDGAVALLGAARIDLSGPTSQAGTITITGGADLDMQASSAIRGNVVFIGDSVTMAVGAAIESLYGYGEGQGAGTPPASATLPAGGSGASYGGIGGGVTSTSNWASPAAVRSPQRNGIGGSPAFDAFSALPGRAGEGRPGASGSRVERDAGGRHPGLRAGRHGVGQFRRRWRLGWRCVDFGAYGRFHPGRVGRPQRRLGRRRGCSRWRWRLGWPSRHLQYGRHPGWHAGGLGRRRTGNGRCRCSGHGGDGLLAHLAGNGGLDVAQRRP